VSKGSVGKDEILRLLQGVLELVREMRCEPEKRALQRLSGKLRRDEFYLTLLGETSSGKSTLANSLINDDLLPVSAPATTGVVTFILLDELIERDQFFVVKPDGTLETQVTREEFRQTARDGIRSKRLLVRKGSVIGLPKGLTIVDTPGYNSCLSEHTEVLRDYLPESDAACFLINYRAGLRKSDLEYFSLISGIIKENENSDHAQAGLFVAINFVPSSAEDKRIIEIGTRLRESAGYNGPIYRLQAVQESGQVTLHDEGLLGHMSRLATTTERTRRLLDNSLTVIEEALTGIGSQIEIHRHIFQAEDSNLSLILKRIDELLLVQQAMEQRVTKGEADLVQELSKACQAGKARINGNIDSELDEASRWTAIESASTYISETVFECGIHELAHDLSQLMHREIRKLNEDLDGLAADAEEKIRKILDIPIKSPFAGIDEKLMSKLAERLGGRGAASYLGRLAGAPGEKGVVGVMNLARKLMGKANRLFGKTVFGREAMAGVPKVLKQFGLTTSRVAGAAAAVALEIARYLYRVATWKGKLRKGLQPVIEEHVGHVQKQALNAVSDMIGTTRQMVEDNYIRRISVLRDTFAERERGRSIDPKAMKSWTERWNQFAVGCEAIRENMKGA
jgi:hypothetical protein